MLFKSVVCTCLKYNSIRTSLTCFTINSYRNFSSLNSTSFIELNIINSKRKTSDVRDYIKLSLFNNPLYYNKTEFRSFASKDNRNLPISWSNKQLQSYIKKFLAKYEKLQQSSSKDIGRMQHAFDTIKEVTYL